jgi:hypothetical protein
MGKSRQQALMSCNIWSVDLRLEAAGHVSRVLVLIVIGLGNCEHGSVSQVCQARWRQVDLTITAVELVFEDPLGVLLGLLRRVGVADVGLVAAGDLSVSGHFGEW